MVATSLLVATDTSLAQILTTYALFFMKLGIGKVDGSADSAE